MRVPLVASNASTKPLTVMMPSGVWLAPEPKKEFAGVAKSTWKRRTKTCVSTVPATAELLMFMNHSACPAGGGEPARKDAGTRLYWSPRFAGVIGNEIVFAGPPLII